MFYTTPPHNFSPEILLFLFLFFLTLSICACICAQGIYTHTYVVWSQVIKTLSSQLKQHKSNVCSMGRGVFSIFLAHREGQEGS